MTKVQWHKRLRAARVLCAVIGLGVLAGCVNLPYYAQAVSGHLELMRKREPIDTLLANADLTPELRADLTLVLDVRDFASEALGLPDNGSYRSYAELGRPYVVWNVVAAPEYSLQPKQWCFWFVGCLAYKGFYDEARARRQGDKLERQGYEVVVGGVAAYSTLGRFEDPFLNTMIGYSDARTANLIFHELAHQHLYVKGDSAFNEAFATFVAQVGVERWFEAAARPPDERADWFRAERRREDFNALLRRGAERLNAVYADGALSGEARADAKADAFAQLQADYAQLRDGPWEGYAAYDRWMASVNNARLASIATYRRWVPAFAVLYEDEAGADLAAFLRAAADLAALDDEARQEEMAALLRRATDQASGGRSSRY